MSSFLDVEQKQEKMLEALKDHILKGNCQHCKKLVQEAFTK